jgi:tetratricopeptide (TPR) repeat protein
MSKIDNIKEFFVKLKIKDKVKDFFVEAKYKPYLTKAKWKEISKKKYFKQIVFALAFVLVISYPVYTIVVKYTVTPQHAEEYFYEANYPKAIEEYTKILSYRKEPIWYLKLSEIYSIQGDTASSQKYIDKAKQYNSKDDAILNEIVFNEFMDKDYKTALIDGEAAFAINNNNKQLIKTMYCVYMANNQIDKAKALIKRYPYDTKSAYDTAEYARMLMISGNFDEGYKKLEAAWNIDKDEYKIYDVLSQTAAYDKDKLLEDIANLAAKKKDSIAYQMWTAKIYSLDASTSNDAQKILDNLKNKDTGNVEIKLIQASVYQNSGKTKEADSLITSIIGKGSSDYRILHTAGWYYLNKKDLANAVKYCNESIQSNKDYPDNYGFLMPEILKANNKPEVAQPYIRTALLKEPYNYNVMLNLANYYLNTDKNVEKALDYFNFAQTVKPDDPEIKYNMALIYLAENKTAVATDLLKQCLKLDNTIPKYHRALGTIAFLKGNTKEAISEFRIAYAADLSDILNLNNAGCYYISVNGNLDRGLYNLQKAYDGINKNTDDYTKKTVTDNYNKAKKLMNEYNSGTAKKRLTVPDFVLFY